MIFARGYFAPGYFAPAYVLPHEVFAFALTFGIVFAPVLSIVDAATGTAIAFNEIATALPMQPPVATIAPPMTFETLQTQERPCVRP